MKTGVEDEGEEEGNKGEGAEVFVQGEGQSLPVDRVKIGVVHRKMEVYNDKRRNSVLG